jgi:peptidoglycan-associated lipoprotein
MAKRILKNEVWRYTLLLVALSLGLTGCQACKNLRSKLPLIGRKGRSVQTVPPDVTPFTPTASVPEPIPTPGPVVARPPGDDEAERPTREPEPLELETVYFDFDSSVLREDARRALDRNIEWLRQNRDARIQVEGHCDERGTEEYNLHLGERRANSVKRYLTARGIEPSRLFTISYGEERPVDPGRNEIAYAKNRRAQFSRY